MTLFMELGSGTLTRIIIGIIKTFYLLEKISTVLLKIIDQETSSGGVGNRSEIAFLGMTFIFSLFHDEKSYIGK